MDPPEDLDPDVGAAGRGELRVLLLQLGDSLLEALEGDLGLGLGRGGVLGTRQSDGEKRGQAQEKEPAALGVDRRPVARKGDV